jgi:transporter family protein
MDTNTPPWWLYALASAFFAALTTIFAKLGVSSINSQLATALRTVVILIMAWGIVWGNGVPIDRNAFTARAVTFLVLSGLATGASWLLYFRALQLGPASLVAAVDKLSLVAILVFGALFLNEPFTIKTAGGALLIVAGTLLLIR